MKIQDIYVGLIRIQAAAKNTIEHFNIQHEYQILPPHWHDIIARIKSPCTKSK